MDETDEERSDMKEDSEGTIRLLSEMIDAQNRITLTLERLVRQVADINGWLDSELEDVAADLIHDTLERERGWEVGELERAWRNWDGQEVEIDLLGSAVDPSNQERSIWILGEVKSNLGIRDVERFGALVARAADHLEGDIIPVCFSYRVRLEVRDAVKKAGYRLILSNGRTT